MTQDNQPPSMRDFDYFADGAKATDALDQGEDLPSGLEEQLLAYHRARRRQFRVLLLAFLALGAAVWFLAGHADWMAYVFAVPPQPLELGDVTDLAPSDLTHNSFVSITGITEHRGLKQKLVRGLSLNRQELWYFRLLGSRGIFVEVEPDAQRYGFATEVKVTGRVVDPARDSSYRALLASYQNRFFPEERPDQRIVQVDVVPRENRWPSVLAIVLVSGLAAANAWALVGIIRRRRDAARRGLLR